MNKYKRKKCVTFHLSYSCLKAKGFHQSLDEVCLSSFSYTVSIRFDEFKWNKCM